MDKGWDKLMKGFFVNLELKIRKERSVIITLECIYEECSWKNSHLNVCDDGSLLRHFWDEKVEVMGTRGEKTVEKRLKMK